MAFQENDLVIKTNNGFVEIIIYGNGSTNDRSIANPPIGSVWAQKQNVTNPQLIQFYLADKTLLTAQEFGKIKDLNGDPFGVDIDSALSAILALIAPVSGGGGGGGATELTQLDIKNNTAPRILTAGYWELSQLGQSTVTLSGVRYIKIERAEQHGTAGTDQVTVTDVQGVVTELFQGDVVEFPQIFNYTYGDVIVQASNSSTIVKITYIE